MLALYMLSGYESDMLCSLTALGNGRYGPE